MDQLERKIRDNKGLDFTKRVKEILLEMRSEYKNTFIELIWNFEPLDNFSSAITIDQSTKGTYSFIQITGDMGEVEISVNMTPYTKPTLPITFNEGDLVRWRREKTTARGSIKLVGTL